MKNLRQSKKTAILRLSYYLIAVACLVLPNCSQKVQREVEIRGQVFIVTNSANNIKLGLVEVFAIPEQNLAEFIERKQSSIGTEREKLERTYETAMKDMHTAFGDLRAVNTSLKTIVARAQAAESAFDYAERDRIIRAGQSIRQEVDIKQRNWKAKVNESARADLAKSLFPPSEYFFDGLPNGIAKATTDAEGRFSLAVPATGKVALAAHSSRQLLGSIEEYYWLVWVLFDQGKTKEVMLTNQNLMTSDSSDLVVRTKIESFNGLSKLAESMAEDLIKQAEKSVEP